MKIFYAFACIVGIAVPFSEIIPFIQQRGFNLPFVVEQIYSTAMTRAFINDFFITGIVMLAFIAHEGWRIGIQPAYLLGCFFAILLFGASCALPLFLLIREIERGRHLQMAS
jgi:uncharacterized membrane protein YqgA involved in biofilm formation